MIRDLEAPPGLIGHALTSPAELDLPALVDLIDAAWREDYGQRTRPSYDEQFVRWLTTGPEWVATRLSTDDGELVGFELALERALYCADGELRVFYPMLLAVTPPRRRQGLGQWLIDNLHAQACERGADLLVSTFEAGRSGSPTVERSVSRANGWSFRRFHQPGTWLRRLDVDPPVRSQTKVLVTRIAAGEAEVLALDAELRIYGAAFGLKGSFAAQYLSPRWSDAGVLSCAFEDGNRCCVLYRLVRLVRGSAHARLSGQIQAMHGPGCTASQLRAAIVEACVDFRERGCFAATLLDHGTMTADDLGSIGFVPTESAIAFFARGPSAQVARLESARPPFWLDSL